MAIPKESAYYARPISLRNPIVFYEGHLPAFAVNTLLKRGLGRPGIDERLEILFARGIDPEDEGGAGDPSKGWPSRQEVHDYVATAEAEVERALREGPLKSDSSPAMRDGQAVLTILEHEVMHQETFLYMLHNLPLSEKNVPDGYRSAVRDGREIVNERIEIPGGRTTLGGRPAEFGWDNEFPPMVIDVAPFAMDRFSVTNGEYLRFVTATGAIPPHFWIADGDRWSWRGMFEAIPLPLDAPVWVTLEEAQAYARWSGGRVATEAEYHRAAFGTPTGEERAFPWGDELPDPSRGNFDFSAWDPVGAGLFPAGASAWGVEDLVGNGWEWTSTEFRGFPGFEPMASYPEYSADFFDDRHFVLKGASPVTGHHLIRRSFRNWFRPNYPYLYAKFRCVYDV